MNILGNWSSCGNCHIGLGSKPEPTASQSQLENIDCLICHQQAYKRVKVNGVFVPDEGNMTITIDQAVQTVHLPVRQNCLQCHAKAGGGDAYKRGDITLAHGNTADATFDRHMAVGPAGADLQCQACHAVSNHRIAGRGSDLAPTDYDFPMGCSTTTCHSTKSGPGGHGTAAVNSHVARVSCQACHIKSYGKNASDSVATEATEYDRDWSLPHYNSATGLWHPTSYLLNDLLPVYKFWNKYSTNYLLHDVARRDQVTGRYTLSKPAGSISDLTTASKLYPFKYKTAQQPLATGLNVLIALDTSVYWATGDYLASVAAGLSNMGFGAGEPFRLATTDTNQLITHGVTPATQALACNECHGTTTQMNLPELGYKLKNTQQKICVQCHEWENEEMTFNELHQKHVQDEGRGCSWCHSFSRPERGLSENYVYRTLTAARKGTGTGTIMTTSDGGINCGNDCIETYGDKTLVTLKAVPEANAKFKKWSGACTGTKDICKVTMGADKTVTAKFKSVLPKLSLNKTQIVFKNPVKVGKTDTKILVITNTGNGELVVSDVTLDNPEFTVKWTSKTIAPQMSANLKVTFAPLSAVLKTGTLSFTSNDPDFPTVSLPVTGTGK